MSTHSAPVSTVWIIRFLVAALIVTAFLGGYYNVRFELSQKQLEQTQKVYK